MNRKTSLLWLVATVLMTSVGWASTTSTWIGQRAKKGTPVVPGQWHADFTTVKNFAIKEGRPFFAVWSNGENCSHCLTLEKCFNTSTFKNWMKTSGVVFWCGYEGDTSSEDGNGGKGFDWCYDGQQLYPLVRLYWKDKSGKVRADWAGMGDNVDGGLAKDSGAKKVISFVKSKFKGWDFSQPVVSAYAGGEFGVGNTEHDRLEVEAGKATAVTVPLVRTNATVLAQAATNTFRVLKVDGSTMLQETKFAWEAGQSETNFTVNVPSATAGQVLKMYLLDEKGASVRTNAITCVKAKANGPSNPYWLKEKTAATLKWGEWTADFVLATNIVKSSQALAAANRGKGTLVVVSGSKWCPDCVKTDKNFLEQEAIRTTLKGQRVACAVVDVPKFASNLDYPSILTYRADVISERYSQAEKGDASLKGQPISGAEYLSRHAVKAADAAAQAALYKKLVETSTEEGGLCRPECVDVKNPKTGKFKTGIPALIVLRPEGKVAGRIYQFNNKSPESYTAAYNQRLIELLDLVDDPDEEQNDAAVTAKRELPFKGTVSDKSISAVDQADYYRIPASAKDNVMNFRLESDIEAEVTLSIVNLAASAEEKLIEKTGTLGKDSPLDVSYEIPSANCYLKISYPMTEAGYALPPSHFDFESVESTICAYKLTSDPLLVPTAEGASYDGREGETVKMRITKDETYRLVGMDATTTEFKNAFDKGVSKDLYVAKDSMTVELKLTAATFEYRLWNAGKVSFEKPADSIAENGQKYTIVINRTDGNAGTAQVALWLTNQTAYADQFTLDFPNGKVFTWGDKKSEPQTATVTIHDNNYFDGDRYLVFRLVKGESDAGVGTGDFILTIRDLDKSIPGKLAIEAKNPVLSKKATIVARAESTVQVDVCREGGTSGEVSGELKVVSGKADLSETYFAWKSRTDDPKTVAVTLPSLTKTLKSVKLGLTGKDGTKVDSAKRYLTIQLVDKNAPGFEVPEFQVPTCYRYVDSGTNAVKVASDHVTNWKKIKIKKVSGSLPSGIKATVSTNGVVFTGAPTKSGSFAAVYQVSEGSVAGLTVRVSFTVLDPVTYKEVGSKVPLNASVKSSRTINDIMAIGTGTGEYEDLSSLVALVDLTIPRTGKLSAKVRSPLDGLTLSYSSKSWKTIGAGGVLEAELVCTRKGKDELGRPFGDRKVLVKVDAKGVVSAVPIKIEHFGYDVTFLVPNERTDAERPVSYDDYKGLYTVSLPMAKTNVEEQTSFNAWGNLQSTGDGYVSLKMTSTSAVKSGKMTYAGMLPNGQTFSGSAYLSPAAWDEALLDDSKWSKARLPILTMSEVDFLDGVLELDRDKAANYGQQHRRVVDTWENVIFRWYHNEPKAALNGAEELPVGCSDVELEAWGGKYDPTENLVNCCLGTHGDSKLTFFALPLPVGDFFDYGVPTFEWDASKCGVTVGWDKKAKHSTLTVQSKPATGFKLSFDYKTGIVSGSFRLPTVDDGYAPMTYRGIVMPGWGAAGCTDCGTGDPIAQNRPFVSGTAWCWDHLQYQDKTKGKLRDIRIKRGLAISIGKNAGK